VQTCIWPSGFHCHSLSLASVKSRLVLPFWYRLTRVVPDKKPLNGCVCDDISDFPCLERQQADALLATPAVLSIKTLVSLYETGCYGNGSDSPHRRCTDRSTVFARWRQCAPPVEYIVFLTHCHIWHYFFNLRTGYLYASPPHRSIHRIRQVAPVCTPCLIHCFF